MVWVWGLGIVAEVSSQRIGHQNMTGTRGEDLQTLCLSSDDDEALDGQRRIRKAFLRLSRIHHPDKGGTKEGFQKLSAAYYRLRVEEGQECGDVHNEPSGARAEEQRDDGSSGQEYYYHNFWQNEFHDFFHRHYYQEDSQEDEEEYFDEEEEFSQWEQSAFERSKAWSEHHKQQLKKGKDFRDRKAKGDADTCQFCGVNKPIKKQRAKSNGVNWEKYVQSINHSQFEAGEGYNTCWVCKTNHISVLTESMAKRKFAKKLENSTVFRDCKRAKYTFTQQPVTSLCEETRISEYYWYPDLEEAALDAGWKPHGQTKESVPWQPKNGKKRKVPTTPTISAVAVTPGSSARKKKRRCSEDGDKKPSAKRGLKF